MSSFQWSRLDGVLISVVQIRWCLCYIYCVMVFYVTFRVCGVRTGSRAPGVMAAATPSSRAPTALGRRDAGP